ncbi:Transcriptional regulator, AraC family protein [Minicystis rosea]|nr:Transcriptional regulator, AraC family protein [Minicystis rosea]
MLRRVTAFDEVIGGMRVESSHYAQFRLHAPWGVRFTTGTQARLIVVAQGQCWLRSAASKEPLLVKSGGCLVIKPGVAFDLSDVQRRAVVHCESMGPAYNGSVVENVGEGELTVLVIGRFSFDPVAAEPLVAPMPPIVHVPLEKSHAELLQATLVLMGKETAQGGLGSRLIVDRLTDALFVQTIRAVYSSGGCAFAPGWVTGLTDRRVAKALHAVHADLVRPWTVADMAREAGVSRASFAAAFTAAVGEPPLEYVTRWRIYRAKVLLASTDESLAEIASRVGYNSDTALSRAFTRTVGMPPGEFRRTAATRTQATEP